MTSPLFHRVTCPLGGTLLRDVAQRRPACGSAFHVGRRVSSPRQDADQIEREGNPVIASGRFGQRAGFANQEPQGSHVGHQAREQDDKGKAPVHTAEDVPAPKSRNQRPETARSQSRISSP